jgi:hypothetical protein
LVVNIADDMSLRLQNYLSSLDRTFDFPVHHHALGCNRSSDMGPPGNYERRAVQFAFNLTVDLD